MIYLPYKGKAIGKRKPNNNNNNKILETNIKKKSKQHKNKRGHRNNKLTSFVKQIKFRFLLWLEHLLIRRYHTTESPSIKMIPVLQEWICRYETDRSSLESVFKTT